VVYEIDVGVPAFGLTLAVHAAADASRDETRSSLRAPQESSVADAIAKTAKRCESKDMAWTERGREWSQPRLDARETFS